MALAISLGPHTCRAPSSASPAFLKGDFHSALMGGWRVQGGPRCSEYTMFHKEDYRLVLRKNSTPSYTRVCTKMSRC